MRIPRQQAEEKKVIQEFLVVSGIKTKPDGIQFPIPPAPDVFCTLIGGNKIAFELTEAVDPALAKILDHSIRMKKEMGGYFRNTLSSSDQSKIRSIFGNALISVAFNDGLALNKKVKLLPSLFRFLFGCQQGVTGSIKCGSLLPGIKYIRITRDNFKGPIFKESSAIMTRDKIIDRIKQKFDKKYECNCPIELLIYSWQCGGFRPDNCWLPDVEKYISKNINSSPFQRVWIFDYIKLKIRYVHPPK